MKTKNNLPKNRITFLQQGKKYSLPAEGNCIYKGLIDTNGGYMWTFEALDTNALVRRGYEFRKMYDATGLNGYELAP